MDPQIKKRNNFTPKLLNTLMTLVLPLLMGLNINEAHAFEVRNDKSEDISQTAFSYSSPRIIGIDKKIDNEIQAVATYSVMAYVIAKEKYRYDKESEYSTYDLVLGWNKMADPGIVDQLKITQSNRWYHWAYKGRLKGITEAEVARSSANTHTIPGNPEVERQLSKISEGDVVQMSGYLVNVTKSNGWRWRTSTSPDDSGAGACEIFYVTYIKIL